MLHSQKRVGNIPLVQGAAETAGTLYFNNTNSNDLGEDIVVSKHSNALEIQ
jgi:hypothetical protein